MDKQTEKLGAQGFPLFSKRAEANLESLIRIFTTPESDDSTLAQIEAEISRNLMGFLNQHVVAGDMTPQAIESEFSSTDIPEDPTYVSEHAEFLLSKIVSQSVHTSSPAFIGHMTSAVPYFMLPLAKIMFALNQNLVKIETSKVFTPLERQVVSMLHRLVYQLPQKHYQRHVQDREHAFGVFCSGGTTANITALWVARNRLLEAATGKRQANGQGLLEWALESGFRRLVLLVSERGHYSLVKSADVLGIGRGNVEKVQVDEVGRVCLQSLEQSIERLQAEGAGIVAVVGVAGATETGQVDPLSEMAELCKRYRLFFHVDAAWGGPTLFSKKHKHLLKGIEQADSVTFDAHKQLYVPVGAGVALFKDSQAVHAIETHAQYIIRKGSRDLGRHTLEGSRPGMAVLVYSGLKVMGRKGYQLLIDLGISRSRQFADMIQQDDDFELVTAPVLNLLTYRYLPKSIAETCRSGRLNQDQLKRLNKAVDDLTRLVQRRQRQLGKHFVSRTRFAVHAYQGSVITVFRVVLANPLTTQSILKDVLEEQRVIAQQFWRESVEPVWEVLQREVGGLTEADQSTHLTPS